jgi:hypothetical protein
MSARRVTRLRTVIVGERTRIERHCVLAGGAGDRESLQPSPAGVPSHDPLVLALAQLVRDRWAIERPCADGPLALRPVPSNIASVGIQPSPPAEREA